MSYINIIGDIHGNVDKYNEIVKNLDKAGEYSLQLGDFGFKETYDRIAANPKFHRILGGNHDDYEKREFISLACGKDTVDYVYINQTPNHLGDYGIWNDIFYMRGANSIDKNARIVGIDWWPDEELSIENLYWAIEAYKEYKPKFLATHDCSQSFAEKYLNIHTVSKTRCAIDEMLSYHKPERHFFGHHHVTLDIQDGPTIFSCVNECQVLRLNLCP